MLSPELRQEIKKLLGWKSPLKWLIRYKLKRKLETMGEMPAILLLNDLKRRMDELGFAIETIELSASRNLDKLEE